MTGPRENTVVRDDPGKASPPADDSGNWGTSSRRKNGQPPPVSRWRGGGKITGLLVLLALVVVSVVFGKRASGPAKTSGPSDQTAACIDARSASLVGVDCANDPQKFEGQEGDKGDVTRASVFVARTLPDIGRPEPLASDLLRLLRDLPAQPPVVARISSPYGRRIDPLSSRESKTQFHRGIDFQVPTGTPVVAPAPGIVVAVRRGSEYGRYVNIQHDSGFATRVAHLESVLVKVGEKVRRGDVIATSGGGRSDEGRSTGPHLHFEIRRVQKGRTVGDSVDPARVYALYWKAWDAVQAFPRARVHSRFAPYVLSGTSSTDATDRVR